MADANLYQWATYGALLFWEEQLADVSEPLHTAVVPTQREVMALNYGRFAAFCAHRHGPTSLRADKLILSRFPSDLDGVKGTDGKPFRGKSPLVGNESGAEETK